jgi:hypothetical protein
MTIAASGLLQNTGVAPAAQLTESVANYETVPVVQQFGNIVNSAQSQLKPATFQSLATLGSGTMPGLTNVIPASTAASLAPLAPTGTNVTGLTGLITDTANGIMGDGDVSRFTQVFNSATGFSTQASQFISSAQNTGALANTFGAANGGMNNLVTGGFNQVSNSFSQFGSDLSQLGSLVDLNNLPNLGDPAALLRQVGSVAGTELPAVSQALGAAGINPNAVNSLALGYSDIDASTQKNLYSAFERVTGDDLTQVKAVLGVRTPGITNMADLLDPKKILPNSYQSLTVPTPDGLQSIYNTAGSINTNIERYLQDPNAPPYTGDDPVVRARLGLPPLPTGTTA